VAVYDLQHDGYRRFAISDMRGWREEKNCLMEFSQIDDYLFECCLRDLNAQTSSKGDTSNLQTQRRLRRQCERARRSIIENQDQSFELMHVCRGQDYCCSFRLANCAELKDDWSARMTSLKHVIEEEKMTESGQKIEMIILVGDWNCVKHQQDFAGRCISC
jgi:molecular chaperone DnaK (HSP70)